jgi:hypothetical protein
MLDIVIGTREPFGISTTNFTATVFMSPQAQPQSGSSKVTIKVSVEISDGIFPPPKPAYVISSLLLYDVYNALVARKSKGENGELMCYVTGVKTDHKYVLTKILQPELSERSIVRVRAERDSSHRIFLMLEDYGHGLYAWFHDHLARGEAATNPSLTDDDTQEGLARGGYAAIGGIFSQDGFLRFFGANDADIIISGKGVLKNK